MSPLGRAGRAVQLLDICPRRRAYVEPGYRRRGRQPRLIPFVQLRECDFEFAQLHTRESRRRLKSRAPPTRSRGFVSAQPVQLPFGSNVTLLQQVVNLLIRVDSLAEGRLQQHRNAAGDGIQERSVALVGHGPQIRHGIRLDIPVQAAASEV